MQDLLERWLEPLKAWYSRFLIKEIISAANYSDNVFARKLELLLPAKNKWLDHLDILILLP